MGILKVGLVQDPPRSIKVEDIRVGPSPPEVSKTNAASVCLEATVLQQKTLQTREVYDAALRELNEATDNALRLYSELSSVPVDTPCTSRNIGAPPVAAELMTLMFHSIFFDVRSRLASSSNKTGGFSKDPATGRSLLPVPERDFELHLEDEKGKVGGSGV
jgi:hypothetical protein